MPVVSSGMAAVVGAALLLGLQKVTPTKAWRVFLGIAVLVFIAYGAMPPMALGVGDPVGIASLELMHFVTAAGVLGGMVRWGRPG
jgi:hypothetical protein